MKRLITDIDIHNFSSKHSHEMLWIPPTNPSNFSTCSLSAQCHLQHSIQLPVSVLVLLGSLDLFQAAVVWWVEE